MKTTYFEIGTNNGFIWCAYDYIDNENENSPLVIITPGYEKTARDSLTMSSYLLLNGFRVLRFDARNCCGLSHGCIEDFTLSSLTEDIKYVLEYASKHLSATKTLSVIAISLSARALLKYLAENPDMSEKIAVATSIVGVVDVRHTITQITKEDTFKGYLEGRRYGTKKLLTYDINWDKFMVDTVSNQFLDVDTSMKDAVKIKVPFYGSIMTSEDEWIFPDHQVKVHDALINCHVEQFVIEGASHKIWKNPRSAELALKSCVKIIAKYILEKDIDVDNILKPDITDVIQKNRKEREVILNWGQ